ncbi:hypothetical protein HNP84_008509 [Thermocatellispora tengchongensis]|uniref:Uncharacterized protein n=1 Tax=Thermocatellispora tengchongensis TaxID=1073253 RepID=A0A840PLS7_9ACTN|nr:hypothetical protein [Thermocatellispora tengchongensis]MBB5138751.1 hypothetical protein [Thermocatellispora tengchongensis]
MRSSQVVREQQRAYQQALLTNLRKELTARDVPAVLIVTEDGRPALDVTDSRCRSRRIFVHLPFCWFYWGDQHDERVSFLRLPDAADRITQAARDGWREGEQGELGIDLSKIVDAYRP